MVVTPDKQWLIWIKYPPRPKNVFQAIVRYSYLFESWVCIKNLRWLQCLKKHISQNIHPQTYPQELSDCQTRFPG